MPPSDPENAESTLTACLVCHLLLQKKAKRKRKPRYPKDYDPSKPNGGLPPPDPERWLPKWQRSDAKKKQKRRRDRQVGCC